MDDGDKVFIIAVGSMVLLLGISIGGFLSDSNCVIQCSVEDACNEAGFEYYERTSIFNTVYGYCYTTEDDVRTGECTVSGPKDDCKLTCKVYVKEK